MTTSLLNQLETLMLENSNGTFAIDLNPDSSTYNCILYKHEGKGLWVKQRLALPLELDRANAKLTELKKLKDTSLDIIDAK